jgi:heat shock protein HslJ
MIRFLVLIVCILLTTGCAVGARSGPAKGDTDSAALVDRTWQWVATTTVGEKVIPPAPERYTIRLTAEGRLQARFDCNSGGGAYQASAGRLSFGPMMSTRIACPPDSLDRVFMQGLAEVESFFVEGGLLQLGLKADSGTMNFRPLPGS